MHADIELMGHIVRALRVTALVVWFVLGVYGIEPLLRIIRRTPISGDRTGATLLLMSISLTIFQIRYLSKGPFSTPDWWIISALLGIIMTAMCFGFNRCRGVDPEHKRAAILAHLSFMAITLVAGALS